MGKPLRTVGVLIALIATASLAGCVQEEEMTPGEARSSLIQITQDTAALLDVVGWERHGDATVGPCGDGVNWAYVESAPVPDSAPLDDAKTVADYWESLGITVRINTEKSPVVFGSGGPVTAISFGAGPNTYNIAGTSACAPGDFRSILREGITD